MGLRPIDQIDVESKEPEDVDDYILYVRPDLRDLGISAELITDYNGRYAIVFECQDDLNLYKVSGQCKETWFLRFMLPFDEQMEIVSSIPSKSGGSRDGASWDGKYYSDEPGYWKK